ncbi:glycosyltransferase [Leucobacter massiliensis]|uniref:Mannosyltransferase n=1 Tax=Leucobacter massiliensis TaxID=1686285 RepID=A0A2S9QKS7_9MICO|nr:glycosyltransferase [Leucobacter massiliensis]PRI10190.1 mannosyltransferase [Leucobacter massiliensis]
MATLTLIAEPFPDWESEIQRAAARDLARAVAATAPRGCAARFLVGRGSAAPEFESPLVRIERLPMRASLLPLVWQSGTTARPLDGEFVHALTPMMPLRSRGDDDGSQSSVTIPHAIAWESPAVLGGQQARLFRAYTRRAVKLADAILAPTHATARALQQHYGDHLPVQVIPLAPPAEFVPGPDAPERRAELGLPERYALSTAISGEHGRLEWLFDALRADPGAAPLVLLDGFDPSVPHRDRDRDAAERSGPEIPEDLRARVIVARPRELADVGAVISGAALLAQPQDYAGTGYLTLGALRSAVPVLHGGHPATAELALDAGVAADSREAFVAEYSRLLREDGALTQLSVLACDRSRGFSWNGAAWQLWETHANL